MQHLTIVFIIVIINLSKDFFHEKKKFPSTRTLKKVLVTIVDKKPDV